jgi:hypothetical protein
MKNDVFWDVTPCGSCINRPAFLRNLLQFAVNAKVVPTTPILVTLMIEAKIFSETSAHSRATWCHITEDGNLHSHLSENLKLTHPTYSFTKQS